MSSRGFENLTAEETGSDPLMPDRERPRGKLRPAHEPTPRNEANYQIKQDYFAVIPAITIVLGRGRAVLRNHQCTRAT